MDALERMNVNMLYIIGGDGTMKAASAIQEEIARRRLHIAVVGIPKTIDNDINFVPKSFGFDTAVVPRCRKCCPSTGLCPGTGSGESF